MSEHFLLTRAAKTLSLVQVAEAETAFRRVRQVHFRKARVSVISTAPSLGNLRPYLHLKQVSSYGLRATLYTQTDPGEVESKSSEDFLVKTKAEARKMASALARQHGLKTYRVLDKTLN